MATLATLTLAAQQRCDRVNSSFVSSQEWTDNVNHSVGELYGLLTGTYEDYNVKSYSFTLAGGQTGNSITLGSGSAVPDFFKPRAVWRQQNVTGSGTYWMTLLPLPTFQERNLHNGPPAVNVYGSPMAMYNFYGSTIEILPGDASAGNYQLFYIPQMPQLVNPSDSIDGYWLSVNGWDEYVILDAAAKALIKEESLETAQLLLMLKDKVGARILKEAQPRDDSFPGQIADTKRLRQGNWNAWGPSGNGSGGW